VFDEAIAIYAQGGWAAFTFGAVALAASVGKAALYRRWNGPGELLGETLTARWFPLDSGDMGSLKGDLVKSATIWFDLLTGPHAGVLLHLQADTWTNEEARRYTGKYGAQLLEQGRAVTRRAAKRGEIPAGVDGKMLQDLVVGAVINRIYSMRAADVPALRRRRDRFIQDVVGIVLTGMQGYRPSTPEVGAERMGGV
jgi:hypothetical protein